MTKLFHTRVDNLAHIPHREIVTIMLPCVLHKAHQVRLAIVITAALDGFGHQKAILLSPACGPTVSECLLYSFNSIQLNSIFTVGYHIAAN